jgi:sugar phosphate isomerase/epimerase
MKLCISTLVCPTWTFQQIVDACAAAGVSGIDFRGIASEIDITRLPQFTTEVPETLRVLGEKNLRLPCYNLSTTLVTTDEDRWQSFLDETTRYARLAQQTVTKYLRVFGGVVPRELTRGAAADLARRHLSELSQITAAHDCQILLETHDNWSTSDEVLPLVSDFAPDEVGVLWDIEHPYRKGELPETTASKLGKYIRHVHVKDSKPTGERAVPTLLGEGDLPLDAAITALRNNGYTGWYALETEKRWRAEAPDPEQSIPQFVEFMTKRLS